MYIYKNYYRIYIYVYMKICLEHIYIDTSMYYINIENHKYNYVNRIDTKSSEYIYMI